MRYLAAVSLVIVLATSAVPTQTRDLPWPGIYRTETTIGNKQYKSLLEIRQIGNDVFHIDGHCQGSPVRGVAQEVGNALAISWTQSDGPGITVLQKKRGVLTGQWASRPGDGELREEKWVLIPEKNMKADQR